MEYRCINDIWSYCSDKPRWDLEVDKIMKATPDTKIISPAMLKCTLDKETCTFRYKDPIIIQPKINKLQEEIKPKLDTDSMHLKPEKPKRGKGDPNQTSFF